MGDFANHVRLTAYTIYAEHSVTFALGECVVSYL